MKRKVAALWMAMIPALCAVAAQSPGTGPSRLTIRVETSANSETRSMVPCEVVQFTRVTPDSALTSWSTFGEVRPKPEAGIELASATCRCGIGTFSGVSPSSPAVAASAPYLILEISAMPRWGSGSMDPGPVPVALTSLVLTWRRLTRFTAAGQPLYGQSAKEQRTVRLGEGEDFVWPILITDPGERKLLGVSEVFVRVRAGWAGRTGATEYGALEVMGAARGSEILVDGGLAAYAGADGKGLLPNIPIGQHQVSLRGPSGPSVMRIVMVVKGRTVILSPEVGNGVAPSGLSSTPVGDNSHRFPEFRRARDGAIMVRIPEGEYVMGNLDTERKPQPHSVYVSAFLMDKVPVTWGLFKRFAAATGWPLPPAPYWGIHDDHPVAFVRWDEGRAYCEWAGARLPTEAEREKAARGTDGRMYPWGQEEPSPERGVFRRNWGYEGTDVVGIRPAGASPYGLLDVAGNVWEWCQDWYHADYYQSSPGKDPMGPKSGQARVVRGGSWDSRPSVLSASCRNWGYVGYREGDFGFRCAADTPR